MKKKMFRIGEISKICNVSIKTLLSLYFWALLVQEEKKSKQYTVNSVKTEKR